MWGALASLVAEIFAARKRQERIEASEILEAAARRRRILEEERRKREEGT